MGQYQVSLLAYETSNGVHELRLAWQKKRVQAFRVMLCGSCVVAKESREGAAADASIRCACSGAASVPRL